MFFLNLTITIYHISWHFNKKEQTISFMSMATSSTTKYFFKQFQTDCTQLFRQQHSLANRIFSGVLQECSCFLAHRQLTFVGGVWRWFAVTACNYILLLCCCVVFAIFAFIFWSICGHHINLHSHSNNNVCQWPLCI